ncbi:hypothetical protein ERC79_14065 [Rhodococcus sp. ABRD24]|uniref:hypothetical protein n=1 Tax=Rhodococcus sp. ABRD24 TaxID=2507582 RepID=UPI00103E5C3B|nr:hypothetical protein [Rhodococcus sp. ABRD24]QBJ96951.1 hypothetical protein ERC79_14065 [Rhodococcus sp. ABRD24]
MTVYFLVGLPILVVGAALLVTSRTKATTPAARQLPAGKYRTRYAIGLVTATLACVLMNIGSLTTDIPGPMKALSVLGTVLLLATVLITTVRLRSAD